MVSGSIIQNGTDSVSSLSVNVFFTFSSLKSQKAYVIHWVRLDEFYSVEEAYNDGMNRLEALVSRVHNIVP